MTRTDDEHRWNQDRESYGWSLPEPAAWPFRLPVIRSIRFVWLSLRLERHAANWSSIGIGIGGPNPYDLWVLYAIARGWC